VFCFQLTCILFVCVCPPPPPPQFAPVGVVRPSAVLQQHPHSSTGLQPTRCSFPHRPTPDTPCTHTSGHPSPLSPSVPRSAFHDGDAVPLPTQPLEELMSNLFENVKVYVCVCLLLCMNECMYV